MAYADPVIVFFFFFPLFIGLVYGFRSHYLGIKIKLITQGLRLGIGVGIVSTLMVTVTYEPPSGIDDVIGAAIFNVVFVIVGLTAGSFISSLMKGSVEDVSSSSAKKEVIEIKKEKKPEPKIEVQKEARKKPDPSTKCPFCGGKLSELNYYKFRSGNDVTCEYCGEIISA